MNPGFRAPQGMTVFFEKEAILSPDGYLIQPDRSRPHYSRESLEDVDWSGVNIQKESQGPARDSDSVQHRVIELLAGEADWEIILDDDGTGEVADAVFLRRHDRVLDVILAHCKFSHGPAPARDSPTYMRSAGKR